MIDIGPQTSLGAIVTGHPGLAPDLERLGLDYCREGRRSLAQACEEHGLDPGLVAERLAASAPAMPSQPWAAMAPAELVDHLEATHHARLHDELPRLEALVEHLEGEHGGHHPELTFVRVTVDELVMELEPHLAREECVLFPLVRELAATGTDARRSRAAAAVAAPVRAMLVEHDRVGELLEQLRHLTGGHVPPPDAGADHVAAYEALAALEADLRLHVHKENNVLFPAVVALAERQREPVRFGQGPLAVEVPVGRAAAPTAPAP